MKKRRKKNIVRALELENNINQFTDCIDLPLFDDIVFIKHNLINGFNVSKFNYNLIDNNNINLQSDDLINGRKLKDVFITPLDI